MPIDSSTSQLASASPADDDDRVPTDTPEVDADEVDDDADDAAEGSLVEKLKAQVDDINLARSLDEETLNKIGSAVVEEYRLDENSRADWLDRTQKAMKFALQKTEEKQYPWPKAANNIYPLISQAALEFGSRTYPAVVQNRNVAKGVVWGTDKGTPATKNGKPDGEPVMQPGPDGQPQPVWLVAPGEKRQRADRIGEHMSWQLLEEMPEWEPQTDQGLHQIAITGGFVRKTYRDQAEDKNCSLLVNLTNLVWDYDAASFEAAPRHSEKLTVYPHQVIENERAGAEGEDGDGMWLHIDYGPGDGSQEAFTKVDGEPVQSSSADPDAPHLFIEQHRRWDLDGDGYPEPYVVTVHLSSGKVVRIVARYDDDGIHASPSGEIINRIDPVEHYTLYPFLPNIDGGSYPMGFGQLLWPLNDAINSTLNQMFDAGHLQNAGGGFIGDQLGVASGTVNFQVGKFVRVNTKGQSIRDAVFPLPFNGPSPVLFQLLGTLMSAGEKLASIQNVLTGDAAMANASPTTLLALIEQGVKVYTAITKRIYRAEKAELQKLYRLNRKYITDAQRYRVGDEWREVHPDDYRLGGGVEPIADPTMITDMQKLGRAQVGMMFKDDPLVNQIEIRRRLFEAANMDHIDELMVAPDPAPAQMAQQMAQVKMQQEVADLARTRAAEQKDATQAYLNLALARAKSAVPEQAFIDNQLEMVRLHLESLNTQIKAAVVDHKFHHTAAQIGLGHTRIAADALPPPAAPPPETPEPDLAPAEPMETAA